jgi:hypothetical protein
MSDYLYTLQIPKRGFVSRQIADQWQEGLITGSGVLGALLYGSPCDETIILSREGLFMPLEAPIPPPPTGEYLDEIRGLLKNEQYQQAADFVLQLGKKNGFEEKHWTDPFIPVCDLKIKTLSNIEPTNYERSTDFTTGLISSFCKIGDAKRVLKAFASRTDDLIAVAIESTEGALPPTEISFAQRPTEGQGGWEAQKLFDRCIDSVEIGAKNGFLTYHSRFKRTWPGSLRGYDAAAEVILENGTAQVKDNAILATGASRILIYIRIDFIGDNEPSKLESLKKSIATIGVDFDLLLGSHAAVHGELFERTRLSLVDPKPDNPNSEELIAASDLGSLSPSLVNRLYDAARFCVIAATGQIPPTLCGIWQGAWFAEWSGDYTQNGNLQTAIAANLSTNLPELMLSYFSYQESLIEDYRKNAKQLYNARGIYLPSRTSSHGLQNHFCEVWPMTFWTVGAAWAAKFYFEYYLYTGDIEFLKTRAFPFMREAALFFEDFLTVDESGCYLFSPSYSPENDAVNTHSQACVNATMDIAATKELFTNLIYAAKQLGGDALQDVEKWEAMLAKMPPYHYDVDGALKEWATDDLQENNLHRHSSHLYSLYYGAPADFTPELRKGAEIALNNRLAYRRQEPSGEMAFGLVQMGDAAATLRDAKTCYEIVEWLANWYWRSALTSTHNRHDIFNVDICGGFPDLITRMLIDSKPGVLELLPVLPKEWDAGKIEGIRARGQILINRLEWSDNSIQLDLISGIDQTITLTIPWHASFINGADGIGGLSCVFRVQLKEGCLKSISFNRR